MKFATYVMVFDQEKWIMRNLENAYSHVDKIYVIYPHYPFSYNPEAKEKYKNTFDLNTIKQSKYIDKITIIEGEWATDTDQRNACLKRAKEDDVDYLMVHDADEFYFHEHFERIKTAIRNNPDYDIYEINFYVFWKSFEYILIDPQKGKIGGTAPTIINLHKVNKYDYVRDVYTANRAIINDVICYHGSYVLTDEQVYKKIKIWTHHNDFDVDKWYNEVWLPWTLESRNLHPIWPEAWSHCEIFNEQLPEVIEDFISLKSTKGRNFKFEGVHVGQNPGIKQQFIKILKDFDRIIEIGTHAGGLTLFLYRNKKNNCELISYDIDPTFNQVSKEYNIDFRIGDCFSDKIQNEIKNLILDKSKKILLLCDGGNKNREFNLFSQYLKNDDVIMCHDYAESNDDFEKITTLLDWNAHSESNFEAISNSIKEYNLKKYKFYNDFKNVLWGAFTKKINNYLTKEEYFSFVEQHKNEIHWSTAKERWKYHEKTLEILKTIDISQNSSILESGTMGIQLCKNSDTIDLDMPDAGWPLYYTPTYDHDLTQFPWPIKDKQYDVFIGLRVFHYFLDEAKKHFNEMYRISNHIILAFPEHAAEIYRNILEPTYEIKYPDVNTTILYYNLKNKKLDVIVEKSTASTIERVDNLIYKEVHYKDLTEELIQREIYWLKKLEKYDIAPKFIKRLDNTIIMTYCGENITKEKLKSSDIQKQLFHILEILLKNHCYHNDFNLNNILLLNGKIYIIDFGWCPMIKEDYTCNNTIDSKLLEKPYGNFFTLFDYL